MQVLSWLGPRYEEKETVKEYKRIHRKYAERLKKLIHDLYSKYISRTTAVLGEHDKTLQPEEVSLANKLKVLLEKNMVPGMQAMSSGEVVIVQQLLRELGLDCMISPESWPRYSLKVQAYMNRQQGDQSNKLNVGPVTSVTAIRMRH